MVSGRALDVVVSRSGLFFFLCLVDRGEYETW